jgi:hypothetical protein
MEVGVGVGDEGGRVGVGADLVEVGWVRGEVGVGDGQATPMGVPEGKQAPLGGAQPYQ